MAAALVGSCRVYHEQQNLFLLAAKDPAPLCSSGFMDMARQGQTWWTTLSEEPPPVAAELFIIRTASAKEWGWQKAVSDILGFYSSPDFPLGLSLDVGNPQCFCCLQGEQGESCEARGLTVA